MSDAQVPTGCGHGHVFPAATAVLARCGGPALCRECWRDARALERLPEAEQAKVRQLQAARKALWQRPGRVQSG